MVYICYIHIEIYIYIYIYIYNISALKRITANHLGYKVYQPLEFHFFYYLGAMLNKVSSRHVTSRHVTSRHVTLNLDTDQETWSVRFPHDEKLKYLTVRTLINRRHFIFDGAPSPGHLSRRNIEFFLKTLSTRPFPLDT